jgi:hypothetical protein
MVLFAAQSYFRQSWRAARQLLRELAREVPGKLGRESGQIGGVNPVWQAVSPFHRKQAGPGRGRRKRESFADFHTATIADFRA